MQRFWNQDEVTTLRNLAGITAARTIAMTLHRSKNSVLAKIRELGVAGIPRGSMRSCSESQLIELQHVEPGVTSQQFAESHHMDLGVVRYWARKLGVKFIPSRLWTEEDRRVLREAKDLETAMSLLGRNRRVVYDQARLIGVKLGGINHSGPTLARVRVSQPAVKKSQTKKPPARYRSMVWSCGSCHCPVSNWEQHFARMPQCRIARAG